MLKKQIKNNNTLILTIGGNNMLDDYPDVLTINETIEILGISRNLLYDLIHSGTIAALRVGEKIWRINKTDLIMFLSKK